MSQEAKDELIPYLTADFTPPTHEVSAADPEAGAIGRSLAQTVVREEVELRFGSRANQNLGHAIDHLLEPADITNSFKMFITNAIRRAHAEKRVVDDAVAPDRLGLSSGLGIYDANQAEELEAQALRGFLFDVCKRHLVIPETEEGEGLTPVFVGDPKLYTDAIFTLKVWNDDFSEVYGHSPFQDVDATGFMEAISRTPIVDSEAQIDHLLNSRDEPSVSGED